MRFPSPILDADLLEARPDLCDFRGDVLGEWGPLARMSLSLPFQTNSGGTPATRFNLFSPFPHRHRFQMSRVFELVTVTLSTFGQQPASGTDSPSTLSSRILGNLAHSRSSLVPRLTLALKISKVLRLGNRTRQSMKIVDKSFVGSVIRKSAKRVLYTSEV